MMWPVSGLAQTEANYRPEANRDDARMPMCADADGRILVGRTAYMRGDHSNEMDVPNAGYPCRAVVTQYTSSQLNTGVPAVHPGNMSKGDDVWHDVRVQSESEKNL